MLYFFEKTRLWTGRDKYTALRHEELEMIHSASLYILENVGCWIGHPRMLKILDDEGWDVDHRSMLVRFKPDKVEEVLSRCRKEYSPPSGEPRAPLHIGGFCTNIYDSDIGGMRTATKVDLEKATIIGDYLENVASVGPLFNPQDVLQKTNDVHMTEVLLTKTGKWGGFQIFNKTSVKPIFEMLATAVGDAEKVRKEQMLSYPCYISSPLKYTFEALDIAFEAIDTGVAVRFGGPDVVMGFTGPITPAGTLALSNAETLVGIMIEDATEQQTTSYWNAPITIDPHSGLAVYSSPDKAILCLAIEDLGKFYGLPAGAHIGYTDARKPGIQAAFEKCYGALLHTWKGESAHVVGGLMGPGGRSGCIEQIVIDCEFARVLDRLLKGIEVNEETLAVDVVKKVGIAGNFFKEKHTLKHFRDSLWFPYLFVRKAPVGKVEEEDEVYTKAKQETARILATHDPHPLDKDQEKRIKEITKNTERNL